MNVTNHDIAALVWSQFWQISALIAVVAGLGATIFRRRPHLMHVAWVIVFIKCLTLPVWSSPVGIFSRLQPPVTIPIAASLMPHEIRAPAVLDSSDTAAAVAPLPEFELAETPLLSTWMRPETLWVGAGCAWLLVAFGLTILMIYRWRQVARRMQLEQRERVADAEELRLQQRLQQLKTSLRIRRPARLHVSDANVGPMVFGFLRPVIIFPRALVRAKSVAELEPALMHELLHIRRGDSLLSLLQVAAQIVWWFHPLVWWANRKANQICERCCDEEAVANLNCRPVDYARCLVDALEIRAQAETFPAAPGIRPVDITSLRLQHILRNAGRFRTRMPRIYTAAAIVLAFVILPGAALDAPQPTDAAYLLTDSPLSLQPSIISPEWEAAVARYRKITSKDKSDARAWFMLGYTLHMNGRMDEAIVAHRRAAEFPSTRRTALYNLGCAYAIQGQPRQALETLQQAVDAGFISRTPIEDDPDLAALKDLPQFDRIAEAARPAGDGEVRRQLDFWIGKWHVYDPDGRRIGSNVITRDADGFLIVERWKELNGATGTSINFYDPAAKTWKQTAVDGTGKVIQYSGQVGHSRATFEGRGTEPDGRTVRSRVFYRRNDDGSVRQLVEQSYDDGKTWETSFEGRYVRQRRSRSIKVTVTAG